jgi:methanogenic corrinoid protein MtbC1
MPSPTRFAAALLRQGARACAVATVEALARRAPRLAGPDLPSTFADPIEDTRTRVLTLAEALDVDRAELLADQIAWYKVAFAHRDVPAEYLPESLRALGEAVRDALPAMCHEALARHLAAAEERAASAPIELPSTLEGPGPLRDEARRFLLALLENRRHDAIELVLAAHRAGASTEDLHDHVLTAAQREVGRMWLMAEIPVGDEHFASRVVETCVERLASLRTPARTGGARVLVCGAGGDQHALGLRLVAERFELHGFDVWNLGADMPAGDFAWLLYDRRVDLIALGATMVLHVGSVRATIERLRADLGWTCPPLLVGGRPFVIVPDLHAVVGADAAADDPATAVVRARALLARR